MSMTLILIALGLILAWNFIPAVRQRMRGWSTILEGFMATILTYFGNFAEALQEAQQLGYLPENVRFQDAIPAILFAWVVIKRFQTKTPVGKK